MEGRSRLPKDKTHRPTTLSGIHSSPRVNHACAPRWVKMWENILKGVVGGRTVSLGYLWIWHWWHETDTKAPFTWISTNFCMDKNLHSTTLHLHRTGRTGQIFEQLRPPFGPEQCTDNFCSKNCLHGSPRSQTCTLRPCLHGSIQILVWAKKLAWLHW